uniref:NADH dehydrogenase subunit 5 n=1 Tax=Cyphonia clavata TaxID=104817 RepID=UPI0022FD3E4F|nr:NADH dehydrogenase subunit 5 [Cyphonia clavata]WAP90793.1 NADH dehydrogenase subunit 5 [Cyphonia clavata]
MFNKYYYWFFFFFFFSLFLFYLGFFFFIEDLFIMFEYELFFINSFFVCYVVVIDWRSLIFISIVTFISSMVIIYSFQYMGFYSYSSIRFLILVLLFIFSMLLMILSPSLLSILLGWDGLGLVSYCLVIYYNSLKSYIAGMITCLTNRLGDIGILICVSWVFSFGSWHFMFYSDFLSSYVIYLLIFSSFTKSAQIPFSCWLPAAMAAPTPVSALVHSSTLVTAGVYLLIRFLGSSELSLNWFVFFSLFTMIFSSVCASYEFDLKKIVALSTLSQLGLMMTSIFLNLSDYAYFHMLSHAMFKSLLFLCSGIYIYVMSDNQDIRFMGSLCSSMPLTTSCFNISNLALCGVPFMSGFYSKDLIVEFFLFSNSDLVLFFFIYLSLGLSCCYTSRLLYYTVYSDSSLVSFSHCLDYFDLMKLSILCLSVCSVCFGCSFVWLFGFNLYFIIFPFYLSVLSFIMVVIGFWLGFEFNNFYYYFSFKFYLFNSYMWYMNGYSNFLYNFVYSYGYFCYHSIFWGEFSGFGFTNYLFMFSDFFHFYISSNISVYMVSFMFWFFYLLF